MDSYRFVSVCDEVFVFLDEFGYKLTGATADALSWEVAYVNSTTAIKIVYEQRDQDIFIRLQPTPDSSGHAEEFNFWYLSFYLQNVLQIRAPEALSALCQKRDRDRSMTDEEIINYVDRSAKALFRYADDVLRGDFSIFGEITSLYDGLRLED
jgi:hypothetical protein